MFFNQPSIPVKLADCTENNPSRSNRSSTHDNLKRTLLRGSIFRRVVDQLLVFREPREGESLGNFAERSFDGDAQLAHGFVAQNLLRRQVVSKRRDQLRRRLVT